MLSGKSINRFDAAPLCVFTYDISTGFHLLALIAAAVVLVWLLVAVLLAPTQGGASSASLLAFRNPNLSLPGSAWTILDVDAPSASITPTSTGSTAQAGDKSRPSSAPLGAKNH
jgi:hypothetical protein